jgi:hypothetical protein
MAEGLGQAQTDLAGAQEDFRGTQRASRQDHGASLQEATAGELAVAGMVGIVHHITTIGSLHQIIDRHLGEDLGSVLLGKRQVIHVEGVFRAHIAAGDTIPTQRTQPLVHTDMVRPIGVASQVDCHIEGSEARAQRLS